MEDFRNRIAVVGLQDDRVLVEDDYGDYPDLVILIEVDRRAVNFSTPSPLIPHL